jgi:sulfur carrier protein ThiS
MANSKIIQIHVGAPESDKKVSVSTESTVAAVLEKHNVSQSGMIQLNGRTLRNTELNKTLHDLGVVTNDSIYVVRKMDGANKLRG